MMTSYTNNFQIPNTCLPVRVIRNFFIGNRIEIGIRKKAKYEEKNVLRYPGRLQIDKTCNMKDSVDKIESRGLCPKRQFRLYQQWTFLY